MPEQEFFAKISQTPQTPQVRATAMRTELLDWRNVNGVSFTRRADGVVWVTNEDRLTPMIRAAIDASQDTFASLVSGWPYRLATFHPQDSQRGQRTRMASLLPYTRPLTSMMPTMPYVLPVHTLGKWELAFHV